MKNRDTLFAVLTVCIAAFQLMEPGGVYAQSCVGQCGGSSLGCYCDSHCTTAGDCCADYESACAPDPSSCSCTEGGGNMSIAGDYMFAGPRTGYVMLPSAAFTVGAVNSPNVEFYAFVAGRLSQAHSTAVAPGTVIGLNIAAPVQLPLGATPTEVVCEVFSHRPAEATVSLDVVLNAHTLGSGTTRLATLNVASGTSRYTSGSVVVSGAGAAGTSTLYSIAGTYSVPVGPGVLNGFTGCRVAYTVDRILP